MLKCFGTILLFCLLLIAVCLEPALTWSQSAPNPKLVEGARREGELIWYTTMTLDQSQQVVDRFQKKYPFIKPTLFRTGGGPLLNKIFTEARGGLNAWDVAVGRGEMVLPLMEKKLIAAYRSPETKMIDDDLVDSESFWTAYYVNGYVLGYNTKLVRKEDAPKTYEALLNPKWKADRSRSIPRPTACFRDSLGRGARRRRFLTLRDWQPSVRFQSGATRKGSNSLWLGNTLFCWPTTKPLKE